MKSTNNELNNVLNTLNPFISNICRNMLRIYSKEEYITNSDINEMFNSKISYNNARKRYIKDQYEKMNKMCMERNLGNINQE